MSKWSKIFLSWVYAQKLQNTQLTIRAECELCTCNAVCCLQRACSRAHKCWLKDSWSEWMAAAAEASTCCLSCSPSSWRTNRESLTEPSPLRSSCGKWTHAGHEITGYSPHNKQSAKGHTSRNTPFLSVKLLIKISIAWRKNNQGLSPIYKSHFHWLIILSIRGGGKSYHGKYWKCSSPLALRTRTILRVPHPIDKPRRHTQPNVLAFSPSCGWFPSWGCECPQAT